MFKPSIKYRHQNCLDVDIIPHGIATLEDGYYHLYVSYWNRNYKFVIDSEKIKIKQEDLKFWSEVVNSKIIYHI